VLALIALSACDQTPKQHRAFVPGKDTIPVILVAGQSNAVGQGSGQLPAVDGVSWMGISGSVYKGIGISFGQTYLKKTGRSEVIIAMCAVGGTSIAKWKPGGELFNQCTNLYQTIQHKNPRAQMAGILFWQGEADKPGTPWAQNFIAMIRAFRASFGAEIPVIFAQIDQYGLPIDPETAYIQAQQASVYYPSTTMVKTSDVQTYASDHIHITAPGLKIVGKRMAKAYFRTIDE